MKRHVKRMMKSVARAMWKRSGVLRRPLSRKFQALMHEHVSRHFHVALENSTVALQQHTTVVLQQHTAKEVQPIIQELSLVLDGVVRELTRLQNQVEMLHQRIEEQSAEASVVRFSTIGEADDFEPYAAGNGECLLAMGSDHHWNRKSG
jgi:hypothetical protein